MNYHFTREQLDSLLTSTIEMFIAHHDQHGHEEDYAAQLAINEMLAGLDADRKLAANDPTEYLHLQLEGD